MGRRSARGLGPLARGLRGQSRYGCCGAAAHLLRDRPHPPLLRLHPLLGAAGGRRRAMLRKRNPAGSPAGSLRTSNGIPEAASRRDFIKASGLAIGGAAAFSALPGARVRASEPRPPSTAPYTELK